MSTEQVRRPFAALAGGTVIGALGGLIGLGGAEFRLPLLLSVFRFSPLEAIILNKATSLVVVASAFVFRTKSVPIADVLAHAEVVVNLLAGSLVGAWLGASWATRMHSTTLYKVIAVLLVAIAAVLLLSHDLSGGVNSAFDEWQLWIAGVVAGLIIGIVASLRRCWRRAPDTNAGASLRNRHQAGRQLVTSRELPDDAGRVCAL